MVQEDGEEVSVSFIHAAVVLRQLGSSVGISCRVNLSCISTHPERCYLSGYLDDQRNFDAADRNDLSSTREPLCRYLGNFPGRGGRYRWAFFERRVRPSTTGADMLIAIVNQSTLVSDQDAATMTQAIAAQVRLDVAPLWHRAPAAVIFYTEPKDVPVAAHCIAVVHTLKDQPTTGLGGHTKG